MPLYVFKCPSCNGVVEELMNYKQSCSRIQCSQCTTPMRKIVCLPGKCTVNRSNDLDYFGTTKYHEDRAKQCGVPV